MTKGKSTWKYNKLLTARRNYFWPGGPLLGETGINIPGMSSINLLDRVNSLKSIDSTQAIHNTVDLRDLAGNAIRNVPTLNFSYDNLIKKPSDPKILKVGPQFSLVSPDTSAEDNMRFLIRQPSLKEKLPPNANLIQEPKDPELLKVPLTPIKNTENSFLGLDWSNPFKGEKSNEVKNAAVSAVGTAIGNTAQGLLSGGKTSGVGNILSGLGGIAAAIPGPWGAVTSAGFKLFSGAANALLGSKINEANVAKVKENINNLKGFQSNASDWDNLAQNWANAATGMNFSNKFIGSDGLFSNKVSKLANSLRNNIEQGKDWVERSLVNNAENIDLNMMNNLNANYSAYGGELATNGSLFTNGLLYINNGGSHESNPHEGVQLGVDPEGTPNLVEEGETVFNDFVFSKRLMVPKAFKRKYKMGGLKDISFAEMSKRMTKESEERPNDPISIRGLQAMMRDLAMTQESIKEAQRPNQYAYGGNIFATKGKMRTNKNTGDWSGHYKFYGQDESDAMQFMNNGKYTDEYRNYVNGISEAEMADNYNTIQQYYKNAPENQKKTKRYQNISAYFDANPILKTYDFSKKTLPDNLYDFTKTGALDGKIGGRHYALMNESQRKNMFGDNSKIIEKHMLRSRDGKPTAMPEADIYYTGTKDGYTWADRFKDKYTIANNGTYEESKDKEGNIIKTYYYDPVKKSTKKNNYYFGEDGNWTEQTGDNPVLDIMNKGNYKQVQSTPNNSGGNDYFYSLEKEKKMPKPLPTDWRYAPILGLAGAALSDAFGLTNKPDYSNANAILEASRGAGTYQPVAYQPVGNKLPEVIFDRDNYINKLNAQTGATLRNIMNTAGGNRGTALASIIAADNNALNNIGDLAIKGNEYNWNNLIKKEDFNRGTNSANSTGFLQAATANQQALMNSRQLGLKGAMTAYEMMNNARLAADAAKSANLSKLFTSIGNIGRENMAWNWRNFGIATDSFGHVGDGEQTGLLTHYNITAKGGKLKKKKKGLTI